MFLLTNDDGIEAPGLAALHAAARASGPCRVVAPRGCHSSRGHAVTTHRPMEIEQRSQGWIAVDGSPADCVRLGIHHLASDCAWVLSGVNAGGNLGADVHHSGTVAAAREAALRGRPGIAVSHYIARGRALDWERASRWTAHVLADLLARPVVPGTFWNVNLPHPEPDAPEPEIVECPLDPSPLPLGFRIEGGGSIAVYVGDYQARPRVPDADVATCFGGRITVTLLRVN